MLHIKNCCPTMIFFLLVAMPITFAHNQKTKVVLPEQLKAYVLENMRNKLSAFDEIIESLAQDKLHHASVIAQKYLAHNALNDPSKALQTYMPYGMQQVSAQLTFSAKQFAEVAQSGDHIKAIDSFRKVSSTCVTCHSVYEF